MKTTHIFLIFHPDIATDIDECATSTHNCHGVAHCFNNPGSFSCKCRKNYIGDGIACEPVGEFTYKCHKNLTEILFLVSV